MKWKPAQLSEVVKKSTSVRQVIKKLGLIPAGGNYETINFHIKKQELDISHFKGQGWSKGKKILNKATPLKDLLKKDLLYNSTRLRLRLLKEGLKNHVCEQCKRKTWQRVPIPLELHHKNGDKKDNRLGNLELLCPNCHALTDNYRGKNIGNGAMTQ